MNHFLSIPGVSRSPADHYYQMMTSYSDRIMKNYSCSSSDPPSALYDFVPHVDQPQSSTTIYRSLDNGKWEVPLLEILPESEDHSQLVHCRLQSYSLDDLTPKYRDFTLQSTSPTTQQWASERLTPQMATLEPLSRVHSTRPCSILHRFEGGDYAALSHVWGDASNKRAIMLNGHRSVCDCES
jgi:hypothetical protein